ncbi:MAG: Subunit of the glycosylphosphatidylinositol transamidase complex-like protein [Vezdaea acicularis]|nr:MAG: Subunit of the glycosylphosphatidylinositol transamidase complex-like protein [Vezdaea acicularis]
MSIDIRPVCPSGSHAPGDCILEIEQTIDMVLDIERSKRQHDNPIPRPVPAETLVCDTSKPYHNSETCYPLDERASQGWSISDIFGRYIHGTCPLTESAGSESESVCIEVPHARDVYTSVPGNENKHEGGFSRCFRLEAAEDFQLLLPQQTLNETFPLPQPLLYAERSFTGHGQERGGVQTLLTNPLSNSAVEFVYLESLPWFMKPYLHTLHVSLSSSSHITTVTEEDLIKEMYYRPALDRHRPTHLELVIRLPPDSSAVLTYDFEKAILRYTEYPPDANRGFDVPPAVLRIISPNDTLETVYLRTTSLLLNLPTPDFSMPYNVIILTSTVMALAFGMVFNLLVRRFVGKDEVDEVAGVKGKLLALFGKMRRSFTKKGKGENRKNE